MAVFDFSLHSNNLIQIPSCLVHFGGLISIETRTSSRFHRNADSLEQFGWQIVTDISLITEQMLHVELCGIESVHSPAPSRESAEILDCC